MRVLQQLRWQREAPILVKPHELHRHLLDQLETVRRVARQFQQIHGSDVSAGTTVRTWHPGQLHCNSMEHSRRRRSRRHSYLDATLRGPHDDSDASQILDSHNCGEKPLWKTESHSSAVPVSLPSKPLLIEFVSKSVSAGDHSCALATESPHVRRSSLLRELTESKEKTENSRVHQRRSYKWDLLKK